MAPHPATRLRPSASPLSLRHPKLKLLLIPASLALFVPAHAQGSSEEEARQLQAVTVTGVRADGLKPETVEAGTFRGADIMDVPSTINVVTREALELQAASGLYDALRNTAGVTRQQNGGETWDQLVIRGIGVENRTNYRINGSLPYLNFSQAPMENKERVEVLKGASALYYGFTSPAGVVNLVTKRAGAEPVTTLGLSFDSHGGALASADVGRRFGDQQQYGLRVNAAGGALGSYLDGVDNGERRFFSAAFDWRVNDRLTLKADFEYDRRETTEQAGVQLPTAVNGRITLPRTVDPSKLVGPDWSTFRAETTNALLRADYALSDNWALTLEAGHAKVERKRQLAIFRFTNAAAVATGAGNIRGNSQEMTLQSDMGRAELFGTFDTGFMRHELTLGASYTSKDQDPIYQQTYSVASQNLYNPRDISNSVSWSAMPTSPTTAAYETRDVGYYAIDRITLSPQWQLIAGLRHARYDSNQGGTSYSPQETTPMAAVIYKPLPEVSLYASYSEGLEEGETAPTGTANVGTRMSPGISKQKELGARWQAPLGTLVSAAVFDIERPGYYTNADNLYTADGEQRYRGVELSAQGRLSRQLGWQASALWLDPEFRDIGPDYDGKLPENAARRTGSLFLTYDIAQLPGLSVNAGAYYTGRRPVNDLNQAWLDEVTLYGAGVRYATRVMGKQTVWQLNVENLTDKEYWAAGGTRLAAGAPRTFKASVKIDL
ncbi:TonB-dependent siderophore receptor [Azoarcus sp. TTM-91]|uniref:TonB-dependent siderophore receptor n=1 Tax=Azoarcus sp. TTM-91 TaxID=2691581 RepID=UPI00145FC47C|nr:TonB-dependent siderophore receptor [Azoarcus sp. TTM-91]NMG37276.1 TonB-dependent siderophore receptor [Azoarcus sp. TTM-91]